MCMKAWPSDRSIRIVIGEDLMELGGQIMRASLTRYEAKRPIGSETFLFLFHIRFCSDESAVTLYLLHCFCVHFVFAPTLSP